METVSRDDEKGTRRGDRAKLVPTAAAPFISSYDSIKAYRALIGGLIHLGREEKMKRSLCRDNKLLKVGDLFEEGGVHQMQRTYDMIRF